MQTNQPDSLWPVSELTLGGGGLGQIWGETTREEAVEVVRQAVDSGITLLDVAPLYGRGEAENVIGAAFQGKIPDGVHISTKCLLGTSTREEIETRLEKSLLRSLESMQIDSADLFFLHSQIIPDDFTFPHPLGETQERWSITIGCFNEIIVPAFEKLKSRGLIKAWGITGSGLPETIMQVLRGENKPAAVQVITNLLDSPGSIKRYNEPAQPRDILATAVENGVAVFGIRAVQAGALCANIDRPLEPDHPEQLDYARAQPFRDLCKEWGKNPAIVAHQYALAMPGVASVILGIKNRDELQDCLDATSSRLTADEIATIDALGLRAT